MNKTEKYCKKLIYKSQNQVGNTIILGLIEEEDNFFVVLKTLRRTYRIAKSQILSIEDTEQIWKGA